MSDELSDAVLEQTLGSGMGRPFRFIEQVGSTNTEALTWAREGAPEGALVTTDHQTSGRGRLTRSWVSVPGRLLQFSVILRPRLALDQMGLVTTALGVACAEAIEQLTGLKPTIKWPNDVRIGGRKVAGILVETRLVGSSLDVAVAGMGVNVGWSSDEIPSELSGQATSVRAELEGTGRPAPSRAVLLREVIDAFEGCYRFLPHNAPGLIESASERSDVLGREVVVALSDDATISGTAIRLLAAGELELATEQGRRRLSVGEVQRLR